MTFKNTSKTKTLAIWMVVVPMLLGVLYYTVFAADRYVSSAQAVVRQAGSESSAPMPGLALMIAGGVNPSSREETLYLREYITSIDMLKVLQKDLNWNDHYNQQVLDPLYWLSESAPQEDVLKFYRRVVQARYDETTGLLTVEVQALTPEFAEQVLQAILHESERFVDELSHNMALEQVRFANEQMEVARENYSSKQQEMLEFQNVNELLNAQASAESRATIIGSLEAELTKERASLKTLQSTLGNTTPQVRQQRVRIKALEQQLDAEKRTLTSNTKAGGQLNVIAAKYRDVEMAVGIAEQSYKASVVAVENARIEAGKKIRSLVKIVTPNMPQEAVYPTRVYNLATLFIVLLLIYGIAAFVLATIEDHRD
ncbi:ABC transporter permease [Pusillimonas sp. ANT_WB101]|uniref:ABC transporter permease n=1 Tax=Pusillimonas sp. ANT_WB101 TaxID=2597356 RepID=UPI0011EDFA6E|nr:ABC transporter permease [Pusillimonas sp. ANT_WB101]KAA0911382.1 ABC transporter permease [Pusillimonas sp. ANT_WB101]